MPRAFLAVRTKACVDEETSDDEDTIGTKIYDVDFLPLIEMCLMFVCYSRVVGNTYDTSDVLLFCLYTF